MNDNLLEKRKQRFYLFIKLLVPVLLVLILSFCRRGEYDVQSNQEPNQEPKPVMVAEVVNVQDECSHDLQEEQQIGEELQVSQIEKQEELNASVQTHQQEDSSIDLVQEKEELIYSKDEQSFDSREKIKVLSEGKVEAAIQSEQPKISTNDSVTKKDLVEAENVVQKKELSSKINRYHPLSKAANNKNIYLPYLQIGGTRFFNVKSKAAAGIDFFVPLWQSSNKLIFTDIRFYDRSGKPFEGNIHLGYRYLSPEKQRLYGVYGAFDRKRSELGNYFNQLTLGAECWLNKLFIGGNFYQPIGSDEKFIRMTETSDLVGKHIGITKNKRYEKALRGIDAEFGYELTRGLTGYVGGYYFKAKDTNTICGPKAKITYDWSLGNGRRVFRVFDKLGLEVGIQKDKPRGTTWYVSANFRIGMLPNRKANLQGVARHMVDLVRRDVDIVSTEYVKKEQDFYQKDGKIVALVKVNEKKNEYIKNNASSYEVGVSGDYYEFISDSGVKHSVNIGSLPKFDAGFSMKKHNLWDWVTRHKIAIITTTAVAVTAIVVTAYCYPKFYEAAYNAAYNKGKKLYDDVVKFFSGSKDKSFTDIKKVDESIQTEGTSSKDKSFTDIKKADKASQTKGTSIVISDGDMIKHANNKYLKLALEIIRNNRDLWNGKLSSEQILKILLDEVDALKKTGDLIKVQMQLEFTAQGGNPPCESLKKLYLESVERLLQKDAEREISGMVKGVLSGIVLEDNNKREISEWVRDRLDAVELDVKIAESNREIEEIRSLRTKEELEFTTDRLKKLVELERLRKLEKLKELEKLGAKNAKTIEAYRGLVERVKQYNKVEQFERGLQKIELQKIENGLNGILQKNVKYQEGLKNNYDSDSDDGLWGDWSNEGLDSLYVGEEEKQNNENESGDK